MAQHLTEINESWFKHFKIASKVSFYSLVASLVLIVHAVFPDVFKTTGSSIIKKSQDTLHFRK